MEEITHAHSGGPERTAADPMSIRSSTSRLRHAISAACKEDGFTLVELLLSMSMFVVVLGATTSFYLLASQTGSNDAARSVAVTEESAGIARMAQYLAEAYQVNAPVGSTTSTYMDVFVRVPGLGDQRMFFTCAYADPTSGYNDCVLYQTSASTPFTAGVAPTGVSPSIFVPRVVNGTASDPSDPVFTNISTPSGSSTHPSFVDISIKTPSKGELTTSNYKGNITISDGVWLRQLDFGR